jgi:hypothetical protein
MRRSSANAPHRERLADARFDQPADEPVGDDLAFLLNANLDDRGRAGGLCACRISRQQAAGCDKAAQQPYQNVCLTRTSSA